MSELKAGVLVTPHNEGMCFHRCSNIIAVVEGETEFYLKSEADKAFEDLEESHKKEVEQLLMEIVKLKNDIADLRDDKKLTDAILDERNAEITELNQKLDDVNELIKTARKMLEDAKSTYHAVMVNAEMRERKLKRSLWKERADNASRIECMFRTLSDIEDDDTRTYWIFGNKWESVFYHLKCHRMKTAYDWTMIWENIECKCRAKAEEYK